MTYKVDNRGSNDQRFLYDLLHEVYPIHKIVYEFPIYELQQRIDLFIPTLGIALEYNGRQHYEYVEFFHKNAEGFEKSFTLDNKKSKYLDSLGIKLVIIPYNGVPKTSQELKQLIDSIPYPEKLYSGIEDKNLYAESKLEEARDYRKKQYQKIKKLKKNGF